MENLEKGCIVQITDESDPWFPCLLIVDEVKSWGIQGYLTIPPNATGNAYYRIENGKFEFVGIAKIVSM